MKISSLTYPIFWFMEATVRLALYLGMFVLIIIGSCLGVVYYLAKALAYISVFNCSVIIVGSVLYKIGEDREPITDFTEFYQTYGMLTKFVVVLVLSLMFIHISTIAPWLTKELSGITKRAREKQNRQKCKPIAGNQSQKSSAWNGSQSQSTRCYNNMNSDDSKEAKRKKIYKEKTPYEILGVSHGATKKEIHSAFRSKVAAFHPDKVSHLGESLQELAKEESRKIIDAYNSLLKRVN